MQSEIWIYCCKTIWIADPELVPRCCACTWNNVRGRQELQLSQRIYTKQFPGEWILYGFTEPRITYCREIIMHTHKIDLLSAVRENIYHRNAHLHSAFFHDYTGQYRKPFQTSLVVSWLSLLIKTVRQCFDAFFKT